MLRNNGQHHLLLTASCLVLSICFPVAAQQAPPAAGAADQPFILRETTREVVLDVVARDNKTHNSVNDLAENEFQVFDAGKQADKNPKHILSMRIVDPHKEDSRAGAHEAGFSIRTGALCALNTVTHYQLAITAASEPGYHPILIKTTRPNTTLSFRHHYYVGPTPSETIPKERKGSNESIALTDAACFHTLFPPTLAVTAHPVVVPGGKSTQYVVVVRPESLAGIGLNGTNTQIHLDLGMCTYDSSGNIEQYFHTTSDRQLTPAEAADAQIHGLGTQLEIPGETPYFVRLVVREHETGNLGIVNVSRPPDQTKFTPPPVGTIRAFGVAIPLPNAFCGDVYEISYGAAVLPDFWNLDPVGTVYTNALNVVDQDLLPGIPGIPGVTHNLQWFGIDYYGEFYITKPGEYKFDLESDDGSRLFIDNQQIIENDALQPANGRSGKVKLTVGLHTIHVPYFQGSPPGVALILTVKPPGESTRPFNLSEFAPPRPQLRRRHDRAISVINAPDSARKDRTRPGVRA